MSSRISVCPFVLPQIYKIVIFVFGKWGSTNKDNATDNCKYIVAFYAITNLEVVKSKYIDNMGQGTEVRVITIQVSVYNC